MPFLYYGNQDTTGGWGGACSTASSAMWASNTSTCTSSATTTWTGINTWNGGGGIGQTTCDQQAAFAQMQMMQVQAQQMYLAQTDEQRQAHQQKAEEYRNAELDRLKKEEAARERAKQLLLEHLSPEQKETFEKNKWFIVEGGRSKQQYRIQASRHSINIEVMEGKKVSHKLCAHLHHSAQAPLHDHILAQKIMLESEEDAFLKIANRHAA